MAKRTKAGAVKYPQRIPSYQIDADGAIVPVLPTDRAECLRDTLKALYDLLLQKYEAHGGHCRCVVCVSFDVAMEGLLLDNKILACATLDAKPVDSSAAM